MTNKLKNFYISDRLLSPEEEVKLGVIIQSNHKDSEEYKKAFSLMTECNLRLLILQVNEIVKKTGADWDDMFSEGYLGLHRAVEKFNPEKYKNCRFATYANYWIKQALLIGINKYSIITVPRDVYYKMIKYKELIGNSFEKIDNEEIKEKLDITERDIENIVNADNIKTVSISEPVGNENYNVIGKEKLISDILVDENMTTPEYNVNQLDRIEVVRKLLLDFDKRDRDIVMAYFDRDEDETLTTVGKKHKLSRERIRQIKNRILEKMKEKAIIMKVERSSEN